MSPAAAQDVRVSVCIPTRNHAAHLEAAIAGALAQDVDGLEVVVADDASTDATTAVVARLRDPRVHVLRHDAPVGVAANRNTCLAAARGRYIAWLDADDERLPGSLAPQLQLLDEHPEVALVHAGHAVMDEEGRELPDWPAPLPERTIEPSAVAFHHLLAANEIATSTAVVRRSAQDAAGPFSATIGPSSTDWEMWLRLALRGAVAYLPARTARYRQHRNTISHATAAGGERLRCDTRVVDHVLRTEIDRIPDPARAVRTADAALAAKALLYAGDALTGGRPADALEAIALAAHRYGPTPARELADAVGRDDAGAARALTRSTLRALAQVLTGTRRGAKLADTVAIDDAWDAELARAGTTVARVTPADAVIAAIAKWDPTLVAHSGRRGCNYPDRELAPEGYPRDDEAAVAHLELLRSARGVTHLVVPSVSAWWLEHYRGLARRLGAPLWRDADCRIFDLGGVT